VRAYLHTPDAADPVRDLGELDPATRLAEVVELQLGEQLWVEDGDDPVDSSMPLAELTGGDGASRGNGTTPAVVHLQRHRRNRITVVVSYNGRTVTDDYSPATTIAKVQRRAVRALNVAAAEAADLVLQQRGATESLDEDEHLGTLVGPDGEKLELDLVPAHRFAG